MLGIIGGVGPLASVYFYEKIVLMTNVNTDQEHLNMIILNHATIPDRTEYILGKSNKNPLDDFLKDINMLEKNKVDLIAIPCNTACYFHKEMEASTKIPILNMIEVCINNISKSNIKKIGIMATEGTIKAKLYQHYASKYNIECVVLDEEFQNQVMHIIYDYVKANLIPPKEEFMALANKMQAAGAMKIILGCTELSVLKKNLNLDEYFIDPLDDLAIEVLNYYNKPIKKDIY